MKRALIFALLAALPLALPAISGAQTQACDKPVATIIVEEKVGTQYNLGHTGLLLVQELAQKSGCYRVLDKTNSMVMGQIMTGALKYDYQMMFRVAEVETKAEVDTGNIALTGLGMLLMNADLMVMGGGPFVGQRVIGVKTEVWLNCPPTFNLVRGSRVRFAQPGQSEDFLLRGGFGTNVTHLAELIKSGQAKCQ